MIGPLVYLISVGGSFVYCIEQACATHSWAWFVTAYLLMAAIHIPLIIAANRDGRSWTAVWRELNRRDPRLPRAIVNKE